MTAKMSFQTDLEDIMIDDKISPVLVEKYGGCLWISVDRDEQPCLLIDMVNGEIRVGIYHDNYDEPDITVLKKIKL